MIYSSGGSSHCMANVLRAKDELREAEDDFVKSQGGTYLVSLYNLDFGGF